MTQCQKCNRPAKNQDWYPTFPEAYRGPRQFCEDHHASHRRLREAMGWFADIEAVAQFQECEFIVRATENGGYHSILTTLFRHGSHVAGHELGQPIEPGRQSVYVYNGLLWLSQLESITILGDYDVAIKRYHRLAAVPKKLADRTLASFF
jgi:hypothetical protein